MNIKRNHLTSLADAEIRVADLEQESRTILEKLDRASADADAASIVDLTKRLDELPLFVWAARLEVEQIHLAEVELKLPAALEANSQSLKALADKRQSIMDAQAELEKMFQQSKIVTGEYVALLRHKEARQKRIQEIQQLIYKPA